MMQIRVQKLFNLYVISYGHNSNCSGIYISPVFR